MPVENWNVEQLTSRERVSDIHVKNPLKEYPTCTFERQRVVVDANDVLRYWTPLEPWTLNVGEALQDAALAPFIQQIMAGLEGLTQILHERE